VSTIAYRPATLDDASLASDLMTAAYPGLPQDPVVTRSRWETPREGWVHARFIAERDGLPIAFLSRAHEPTDDHCYVDVWLDMVALERDLLLAMWTWIGDQAVGNGARLLVANCAEDEPEMLGALASLGYRRERTEKVWELDLARQGSTLQADAANAKRDAARLGIELTTVDAWRDPDALAKLHELDDITRLDIPTTVPIPKETYEDFVRRTSAPDRLPDRMWVALDGDQPVGLSYLRFPPVRGNVWTGYTCTHPAYRGRGLGRAVKLQSLAQAAQLGVPCVMTGNDSENAPMLHINERLGYVRRPGFVEHHKRVSKN
jgi:RimJ/RimL family protein N-acetyltransferase